MDEIKKCKKIKFYYRPNFFVILQITTDSIIKKFQDCQVMKGPKKYSINQSLLRGWGPIIIGPSLVIAFVPESWPRWLFMWVLSISIFLGCKWLTWRRSPAPGASLWRHAGYLFFWPGLDAPAFLGVSGQGPVNRPSRAEWRLAGLKFCIGIMIFWFFCRLIPKQHEIIQGWCGMTGIIMMLHFGVFHLLSCGWRALGVDARPLMNYPLVSVRVSEFWGRRWNTAFRDLTHRFLFRPLSSQFGPRWSVFIGFLFSGIVHDLVISVPAGAGYGTPTLFFVLQAFGLLLERSHTGNKIGLGQGWRGWLFTMALLALPAYGLFHPSFVRKVIIPFMEALGSI